MDRYESKVTSNSNEVSTLGWCPCQGSCSLTCTGSCKYECAAGCKGTCLKFKFLVRRSKVCHSMRANWHLMVPECRQQ